MQTKVPFLKAQETRAGATRIEKTIKTPTKLTELVIVKEKSTKNANSYQKPFRNFSLTEDVNFLGS